MWFLKITTVPVLVGTLGMIKKRTDKQDTRQSQSI